MVIFRFGLRLAWFAVSLNVYSLVDFGVLYKVGFSLKHKQHYGLFGISDLCACSGTPLRSTG